MSPAAKTVPAKTSSTAAVSDAPSVPHCAMSPAPISTPGGAAGVSGMDDDGPVGAGDDDPHPAITVRPAAQTNTRTRSS